jgi:DNA-binding MarR family transcriptional regulator
MADDFAILAAIDAAPLHPYEVLDHLRVLGVDATRSTLHRRVEALIVRGAIETSDESGRVGDRALRLTAKGQRLLAEHVITLLRYEPFDSPLFALAAASAQSDHSGLLHSILRSRIASAASRLTEEETALASSDGDERYWTKVGRERVIAHLQADITWLQSMMTGSHSAGANDDSHRLPQAG